MKKITCLIVFVTIAYSAYADCPCGFSGSNCKDECCLHFEKANIDSKIVGGQVATAYSWPATAYIMISDGSFCGGTLINRNKFLLKRTV